LPKQLKFLCPFTLVNQFSGPGRVFGVCVFITFELHDLGPRHYARWFILTTPTLDVEGQGHRSKFKVTDKKTRAQN